MFYVIMSYHVDFPVMCVYFVCWRGANADCYWLNVQQPDTSWEVKPSVDGIRYLARRHSDNL